MTHPTFEYMSAPPETQHPFLINDLMRLPAYELDQSRMNIYDVVWGTCEIGDRPYDDLLVKLAHTPLFQRLQSIEQLTLGPDYATMPNTTSFSRWQHIWGSLVFVRKMVADDRRFSERDRAVLELRTLLSDVGHTSFSHLGDWLFQGVQGGEDLHDQDLKTLLTATDVTGLLDEYGFSLDEVVFPDKQDWVECDSPNLCVDRVDYGLREILRWVVPTLPLNYYLKELEDPKKLFEITKDNQLALKNRQMAKFFCAGFSILPTEHWVQPTHRLQLELLQAMTKGALVDEAMENSLHPRDMLYGIDADFTHLFRSWGALFLNETMKDMAIWQRRIFTQARRFDLNEVFRGILDTEWEFPDFPDPLRAYTAESRHFDEPIPPQLDISERSGIEVQGLCATSRGLKVTLPPLKQRAIDPLVMVGGKPTRYSQMKPSYRTYLAGQKLMMGKGYEATVLMRKKVAQRIVTANEATDRQWEYLITRERQAPALAAIVMESVFANRVARFDTFSE